MEKWEHQDMVWELGRLQEAAMNWLERSENAAGDHEKLPVVRRGLGLTLAAMHRMLEMVGEDVSIG